MRKRESSVMGWEVIAGIVKAESSLLRKGIVIASAPSLYTFVLTLTLYSTFTGPARLKG